ncbi:hypothetical protein JL721_4808 [Aureococcus anophagefferens]|nr:hypothetical protein JL721_4808 [Aureococcus anophagefferens]
MVAPLPEHVWSEVLGYNGLVDVEVAGRVARALRAASLAPDLPCRKAIDCFELGRCVPGALGSRSPRLASLAGPAGTLALYRTSEVDGHAPCFPSVERLRLVHHLGGPEGGLRLCSFQLGLGGYGRLRSLELSASPDACAPWLRRLGRGDAARLAPGGRAGADDRALYGLCDALRRGGGASPLPALEDLLLGGWRELWNLKARPRGDPPIQSVISSLPSLRRFSLPGAPGARHVDRRARPWRAGLRLNALSPRLLPPLRLSCGLCGAVLYERLNACFLGPGTQPHIAFELFTDADPDAGAAAVEGAATRRNCRRRCHAARPPLDDAEFAAPAATARRRTAHDAAARDLAARLRGLGAADRAPPPRDPRAAGVRLLERLSRNIQDLGGAHGVLFPGGDRPAFPDDDEPPPPRDDEPPPPRDPRAARALLLERLAQHPGRPACLSRETALRRDGGGDGDGGGGGGGDEPPDSSRRFEVDEHRRLEVAPLDIEHRRLTDLEHRRLKIDIKLRFFKVDAILKGLDYAFPGGTLYIDNDVAIRRDGVDGLFAMFDAMRKEKKAVGLQIAYTCLPKDHETKVPESFCERNGGVITAGLKIDIKLRFFKVDAILKGLDYAFPGGTLYIDNDVAIRRDGVDGLFAMFDAMRKEKKAVGLQIAHNCVPKLHETKVPKSFCERNGGVMFLGDAGKAREILERWSAEIRAHPSKDGHDQMSLRTVLFDFQDDLYDLHPVVQRRGHSASGKSPNPCKRVDTSEGPTRPYLSGTITTCSG